MRADACLKSPGDVARRESDKAVAVWTWDDDESPVLVHYRGQGGEHWTTAASLPGDDWEPLQARLQRVSAASLLGYKHGVANAESDAAVKIAELEAQVAQERQWRVDAQELADKREEDNAALSAEVERLTEQNNLYRQSIDNNFNQLAKQDATIADLTAKLAAVEDGSAFVGEEWFPVGSSVGQLSWVVCDGAAYKDDKMKLFQVRTENLAVAANRYFRYTGPKWAAPLPEPEQPAPPKCLEGVPVVLCRVDGQDDDDHEWAFGPIDATGDIATWTLDSDVLIRAVSTLTPIHHAPDAAGLAEEIEKGGE